MVTDPDFAIPERPSRRYRRNGGVEYVGTTIFRVRPANGLAKRDLVALVEGILREFPYRWGDFFDLPMPLYLVRDEETGDVFRVSIRDGAVRFHVLPETEASGLRSLYDRLTDRSEGDWQVRRVTEE